MSFPPHFGNTEPSLCSWDDRKTTQGIPLENLSARRNVRNISFHHGISTHCCGTPVSQQEEFHHMAASGLKSVGLWQCPCPTWEVSGVTIHARLLWACNADPPKPSLNSLSSWVDSSGNLIFLCLLSRCYPYRDFQEGWERLSAICPSAPWSQIEKEKGKKRNPKMGNLIASPSLWSHSDSSWIHV